jgi:hypothetical protein
MRITNRDLKEPDGWRRSSLRKMRLKDGLAYGCIKVGFSWLWEKSSYHPACLERVADSMRGVSIHGLLMGASILVSF